MVTKLEKGALIAFLLFLASPVLAQDTAAIDITKKNIFSIQLIELQATTTDTLLFGSNFPLLLPSSSLIGVKASAGFSLGAKWHLDVGLLWAGGFGKFEAPFGSFPQQTNRQIKSTVSAWGLRAGLDRMEFITKNFAVFGGPGVQVISASSDFRNEFSSPPQEFENPSATTYSISMRVGLIVFTGKNFGIKGDFGPRLSYTSFERVSVLKANHDLNAGIVFKLHSD
ncbi:MAG: hypothetical protein L0209_12860 [candidate division Zixibacteria bacterium]|nr:hypothetical protein [candidate division Zixibacteria bacterium]